MNEIHPTAIIDDTVRLGEGNVIGPFAVISGDVVLGDGNWLGAGVVIGAHPEVRSFDHQSGTSAGVVIGSHNVIREYAQIHSGWKTPTTIGDGAFLMNQVYIAHDGRLGNGVTMASSALLAGHVTIGDGANLGLGSKVHQFRFVGAGAMVGMGSVVTRDLPPFAMAYGSPARVRGANRVGLERHGVGGEAVAAVHAAYVHNAALDVSTLVLPDHIRVALTASSL